MRYWLAGSLLLVLNIKAALVCAQAPDQDLSSTYAPRYAAPAATLGVPRPAAALGTPRILQDGAPPTEIAVQSAEAPQTVAQPATPIRLASYQMSSPSEAIYRMQIGDMDPHSPFVPPEMESPSRTSESRKESPSSDSSSLHTANFGEWLEDAGQNIRNWCGNGHWFKSDPDFCNLSSPITNPFLFEDPRSVTEIRPIFIFQTIPALNANFNGGNAEFFGTQLRLAITDRFSLTINKLGVTWINPGAGSAQPAGSGWSEVQLGPKFTFWRDPDRQIVAAAGLIFQIPDGSASAFQNTGSLSLVPYVTGAVNFLQGSWGSLNAMAALGYSFPTDSQRSAFFYNSWHLDWDIKNWHRVFPTLEMNWFVYTHSGNVNPVNAEGLDLANMGSTAVGGMGNLSIAPGVRFKFGEHSQVGVAAEFPLVQGPVIQQFRLTVDFIWRY
jgi:hypothetical protein